MGAGLLEWGTEEMRLKLEHLGLVNRRMQHELRCKDKEIVKVKKENQSLTQNIEAYTNGILAAKGNSLIYERDNLLQLALEYQ